MNTFIDITKSHRRMIYGVGINDAPYPIKGCPYYSVWKDMVRRTVSNKYKQKYPSYNECTLDPRWVKFMNFRQWAEENGYKKGMHLDKDLLIPGNKLYGPDTCLLVSAELNKHLQFNHSLQSKPIGVRFISANKTNPYYAQCKRNGKEYYIGVFPTEQKAIDAYYKVKEDIILEFVEKETNPKVKNALMSYCNNIREYIK